MDNCFRPVKIGSLELPGNLFLAPVAGYTDRAFRSLCAEEGASFSFTELASAEAIYRSPEKYALKIDCDDSLRLGGKKSENTPVAAVNSISVNLIRRGESEKFYSIQLFGGEPESIYKAASLLAPLKPDGLDINSGCPVPKVVKNGAGSALMKNPAVLGSVVEAAVRASRESLGDIPVTIKIRSGWDSSSLNYAECARIAVEAGAAMVTLHSRTRAQGYSGKSNWDHLADLVTRVNVPVAGSGDLFTPEDARRMLKETRCAAVMFARGSMGNPFIFSATLSLLQTGKWEPVSFQKRIDTALRHLEMLAQDIGERSACMEMRKQFCAYTKGMPGGAALREKAVNAQTIEEYQLLKEASKNFSF